MLTWYPCFIQNSPVFSFNLRTKMVHSKDSGRFPSALFASLHSVCSKRLCVVQSAHDKDEGNCNPDMSQKKNSTSFINIFTEKRIYSHLYKRSRPLSTLTRRLLRLSLYTTGLNAHLASVRVFILPHIQTVGSTADDLRGGRGTESKIGSKDYVKSTMKKFGGMNLKSEAITLTHPEHFRRPTKQMCLDLNIEQS